MSPTELQQWLNAHGAALVVDGKPGELTRNAILTAFSNPCADAVTPTDIGTIAARLGCTTKQLQAVAKVESGGSAYDAKGRPKMLFERHYFHRLTQGRWSPSTFSQASAGGYEESSWAKLAQAACRDAAAAFSSASWGKFQVMGSHWHVLGYPSPIDMAYATVTGEAASYDMLARFIEHNDLRDALRALSTDPEHCRLFAAAYNGAGYRRFGYHEKLAEAMK